MSSHEESEAACVMHIALALICFVICWYCTDRNLWLFIQLVCWQCFHMYLLGRKEVGFRNFDGTDFVAGLFILYFLWVAPLAYIVSAPALCLVFGRSVRRLQ